MNCRIKSFIYYCLLLMIGFIQTGCQNQISKNDSGSASGVATSKPAHQPGIKLVFETPEDGSVHRVGDQIGIRLENPDEGMEYDSIRITLEGNILASFTGPSFITEWDSKSANPGSRKISAEVFTSGKILSRSSISVILNSDLIPETTKCQVLNTYPHDPAAYTQGLIFVDGFLYEGTGVRGASSLRKLELESGELLASLNLPPDLFGEGICVFDDKIIQLTWTSGFGFIYDKESFKFLRKVDYATQGWGITFDGEKIIMSDGSHYLRFIEPDNFGELSRIEVFDNRGPVNKLNELEFINGIVYANIYTKDIIALIDPETGKVLKYIDCSGLLKKEDINEDTNVLNGIAYDHQKHRLFITGKNWPKLFEIKPVDQN